MQDATNPFGRSFISYRRSRASEAARIVEAHHDLGVPTWQDITNLDEEQTEDELRRVLRSRDVSNSVLWITPEVSTSAVIKQVEIPEILKRHRLGPPFFFVPCLGGGLEYGGVTSVLHDVPTLDDLSGWNIRKYAGDPLLRSDALAVAHRVLERRLGIAQELLPPGEPLTLRLYTRETAPSCLDAPLCLDWSRRFVDCCAPEATWNDELLPALTLLARTVRKQAAGRPVEASGLCSLAAAIALGAVFSQQTGVDLRWRQFTDGGGRPWSLIAGRQSSGFRVATSAGQIDGNACAVMVSVAADVEGAVKATLPDLPAFRALIRVTRDGSFPHMLSGAAEAADLAHEVAAAMRNARHTYPGLTSFHLFLAGPLGLAVLLGQKLNTLGPVQTYEHVPADAVGRYLPAARIART